MCRKRAPTSRFGVGTLFEEKRFACRLEAPEEEERGGRKERQEGEKRQEDRGRALCKDARGAFQGAYAHCLRRTSAHEARKSRSPGIPTNGIASAPEAWTGTAFWALPIVP